MVLVARPFPGDDETLRVDAHYPTRTVLVDLDLAEMAPGYSPTVWRLTDLGKRVAAYGRQVSESAEGRP